MQKFLLIMLFCLLTSSLLFSQSIKFASEEIDLGVIPKGALMSHKFEFKNEGDSPLTINKLESASQTIMATAPNKAIAPGETGIIEVTCVGENFGSVYATLVVVSNAKNGVITLRLKGTVL